MTYKFEINGKERTALVSGLSLVDYLDLHSVVKNISKDSTAHIIAHAVKWYMKFDSSIVDPLDLRVTDQTQICRLYVDYLTTVRKYVDALVDKAHTEYVKKASKLGVLDVSGEDIKLKAKFEIPKTLKVAINGVNKVVPTGDLKQGQNLAYEEAYYGFIEKYDLAFIDGCFVRATCYYAATVDNFLAEYDVLSPGGITLKDVGLMFSDYLLVQVYRDRMRDKFYEDLTPKQDKKLEELETEVKKDIKKK